MKSVLSFTALQLLAGYVSAMPAVGKSLSRPLTDRDFPWHIGVPKSGSAPAKRQSTLPSTWDPPSDLVTPLQEVWDHEQETYSDPLGFENYGFDQVIAHGGKINYCVRWESSQSVTAEQRSAIATAAGRSVNKWISGLAGFDGWPYDTVEVNVVGWAVSDESLLEGDTSGIEIYTTTDADGIPQCDEACGRFFHQDGDYSGCAAGADRHYDESLWLTDGFEGGTGGDWGQRMGSDYFLQNVDTENIHIYLHEIGHTFALDDFYDWTPTGVSNFIMLAGSATEITEFDYWMVRDWWRNLKDRYDLSGVSSSNSTGSSSGSSGSGSGTGSYGGSTSTPTIPSATPTGSAIFTIPADITAVASIPSSTPSVPIPNDGLVGAGDAGGFGGAIPTGAAPTEAPGASSTPSSTPSIPWGSETEEQGHPWWSGYSWWGGKKHSS